ncbi:uncharacterized protein LOC135845267 [Planococcus citri]|uniref:uncharacterized protein LOC135845267 n=1 Tax=Planococcus citri TaxID=170843 RepID=UPI0031F98FAE
MFDKLLYRIREIMKLVMKAVILIMTLVSARAYVETVFEENSLKMVSINFQEDAIFPVTSTLLYSKTSAILFDAQFSLKEAEKLVNIIKETQTTPTSIIITCGDPDYYFGLEAIVKAYSSVRVEILASSKVVNHINQTKDAKLKTWAPQLGNTAPDKLYVPKPIDTLTFYFDNTKQIQMMEIDSYAAYVWIPENKIILGGVGISWNIHVWAADTQTLEMRLNWRQVLQKMIELQPKSVIPGHFIGERPLVGDEAIRFTLRYLESLEEVLKQNNYENSAAVISSMKAKYPNLGEESNLELSAKVLTGEMTFSK